jgi:hypothetical protein
MREDHVSALVDGVDDSILVSEAAGKETGEVADQSLAVLSIRLFESNTSLSLPMKTIWSDVFAGRRVFACSTKAAN